MKIVSCLTAALLGLSLFALPGPSSASFDKGAMFTVAGYTGSSQLSGFPVLVRIAENSPSGFSYDDLHSKSDGDDIAFVGMDSAGLPFEIDTWNTEGESLIWVRLPSMTNGTEFVMCWGSSSSGKDVSGANPWSDYTGVWHMNDPTDGVTIVRSSPSVSRFFNSNSAPLLSNSQAYSRRCGQPVHLRFHLSHPAMVKCVQYPVNAQQS